MDAVARNGEILAYAISEHIEFAGVHSGDATIQFPPQKIYVETVRRIKRVSRQIARALHINGPFNIQYMACENDILVIECNLRASRSFPFVSKVLKLNLIGLFNRNAEHYFRSQINKIQLQNFAHKRERTRRTQVAFNN